MNRTGVVTRAVALAVAALAAGGCVGKTLAAPEILAGGETTVTIKAGSWRSAKPLARDYCARFRRESVATGSAYVGYDQLTTLYTFDCVATTR